MKLLTLSIGEMITKDSVVNKILADAIVSKNHDLEIHDNEFTLFLNTKEISVNISCKASITNDSDVTLIQNIEAYEMQIDDGDINFDTNINYINNFNNLTNVAKQVIDKFECDNSVYLIDDDMLTSDIVDDINSEIRDNREHSRDEMKGFGMCNEDFY